jgi:hypothetical protein
MPWMLRLHCGSTWLLVGLIWLVQLVIYPRFLRMNETEFLKFHFAECVGAGLVFAPLMVIEAGTGVYFFYAGHREWLFFVGVGLIAAIWVSTAVVQAPMHARLLVTGFDAGIIRRLIRTNWVRTIGWTARGVLVVLMVAG